MFYVQPRVGRGNQLFRMFKLRSMRHGGQAGPDSTARDDARITRVGRIIRATSIDELPQLFNILLGHMSFVGPRPHALGSTAGDRLFWEVDERYWRRHATRPGLTGLAQIKGFRGATDSARDLTDRLEADLEYLQAWSFWNDMEIIRRTFRALTNSDAY